MPAKVASDWLNACSGCEIAIVDLGERLLTVLELVQFVHIPALMDHKYFGQMGDGKHIDILPHKHEHGGFDIRFRFAPRSDGAYEDSRKQE